MASADEKSALAALAALQGSQKNGGPKSDDFSTKEKYEYLTEYGTQILCLLRPDEGCTYLSRNFETITGCPSASGKGKAFFDIVHPDCHERLNELMTTPQAGDAPYSLRCRLQHGDGSWQWYLFLIHPKKTAGGTEFVCIVENINDSIQTQNTLQKARLEAELALRARSEFLANMSHDLRTPLNAVIGFAQIIESQIFGKVNNPQYMEYVKHIQESGYDLLSKIEDLLEISNIDSGRSGVEKKEVHLHEIVQHVVGTQMHHAAPNDIKIEHRPLSRDVLLHVDRLKMQHILGHLLANAIRFSHRGGTVTLETALTQDNTLLLRIRDDGVGIPRDKLNDITTALKEDNCWIAKNNHGIGLGFTLTKEFVALHGGTVKLISKANVGTTVYITLPKECLRLTAKKEDRQLVDS